MNKIQWMNSVVTKNYQMIMHWSYSNYFKSQVWIKLTIDTILYATHKV